MAISRIGVEEVSVSSPEDFELVRELRTNPYTILNSKNEILVHIRTNYSKLVESVPNELVHQVCTIYGRSEEATRVINYILENPSFLVPTMRYELGLKKRTIYQILNNLYPWVKMTAKTVPHPNPHTRGPQPHVWIIEGEELLDYIDEARQSYYDTLEKHDPLLKRHKGLEGISARITHQLWENGERIGNQATIIRKCIELDVPPKDRSIVVKQVVANLRKLREEASS